ncbi:MAG: GNAT family protein [Paenibacillus sp.]|uniref:GNAT family N-acetyltransferase n=1 Tax=Paenibacillus sp. TaxID=58172 RepID=UPI002904E6E7|nr:GNAT family protein [Paenibacillus sp.]MDU2241953.1 GNAT family protein [Paenibacillus sp.]
MNIECKELAGQRVTLMPMQPDHAEQLFQAGTDARIWAYMSMKIETIDDAKRLVGHALSARDQGLEFPYVVLDRETDRIVGSTRFLDISKPNRSLEIGWTWYNPAVWRTRINTECKYLLLQYCFEAMSAIRVQLKTDARNTRSMHAIERLGAVKEGTLRNHRILSDGYIRDSVYYSIISQEWPAVKTKLLDYLKV